MKWRGMAAAVKQRQVVKHARPRAGLLLAAEFGNACCHVRLGKDYALLLPLCCACCCCLLACFIWKVLSCETPAVGFAGC
jgi:hypothetical protein